MRLIILGSGPSSGVPGVGFGWGRCDPSNPKNYRLRSSVLVEHENTRILIDTSPDLRKQLLSQTTSHLDAVLFTHSHADHINGIDDLRGINRAMKSRILGYADKKTFREIKKRFGYVINPLSTNSVGYYYKPCINLMEFTSGDKLKIKGIDIQTIEQDHGFSKSVGFRFEKIAYTTDVKRLSNKAFKLLAGIEIWVIGVFTDKEHQTHVDLEEALRWIRKVSPKKAILTHMGPQLDYQMVQQTTPKNVYPAYDGMVIDTSS